VPHVMQWLVELNEKSRRAKNIDSILAREVSI